MENPLGSCSSVGRQRRIEKKIEPSLSNESFLLDDIIIDILSRLPAKDVLLCRCVCRKWRDLTSNRDFTDLHSRRSLPMILKDYRGELALLDRCWELARTRAKIHKVYSRYEIGHKFSHNGLIVSQDFYISKDIVVQEGRIRIYNPIYRDTVNIIVPARRHDSVYGVFFHPVQKEHCTLWRIALSLKPLKVQYRILNLESNPHWRDIRNPCTQNARIWGIRPILIDKCLYWMVEPSENPECSNDSTFNCDIMEYDIRNEEFRVISCPVPVTVKEHMHNVNLVDIDGVVSLVQVVPCKELVEVNTWTLKDNRGQSWTSSHYIVSSDVYPGYGVPKAVAFRDEELVLQSDGRLYVCNLKLGTFRKFGQRYYKDYAIFLSHVTSLVSLRNCKSKICMEEEDEKIQRESGRPDEIQALR